MTEIPYNIKTEAGKELWRKMNLEQGSLIWGPVGEGIEAIEAEMEERAISMLEELKEYWSEQVEFEYGTVAAINADEAIAAIKGKNK